MRGRTKLVSLATLLAVMLTVSMVFASGLVDVSKVSLFSPPFAEPTSPGVNEVFVDPNKIIVDYSPGYQIGDTFVVNINVSSMTDLFSYQVNVTWNPAILNFTGVYAYGDFLARTGSSYGTSRILPEGIYDASNETGYASIAETILGDVAGVTGSGRLVTIEFQIVGYGWTDLFISAGGDLPTTLLTSVDGAPSIAWNHQSSLFGNDGYFSNRLSGDTNGDRHVDYTDFIGLAGAYGSTLVYDGGYNRSFDFDQDGDVDYTDFIALAGNYGRVV